MRSTATGQEIARETTDSAALTGYDVFLSYSHGDSRVVRNFQRALRGLGRSLIDVVTGRFGMRVFRDETDLDATPVLWPEIADALRRSRHFVLMASLRSRESSWVTREIATWLEQPSARERMYVVLLSGAIEATADGTLDARRSTALAPDVCALLATLPLYADLRYGPYWWVSRWWRLRHHAALMIAAPVRDIPMDVLDRKHRAVARRFALAALLVLSTFGALVWRFESLSRTDQLLKEARDDQVRNPRRSVELAEEARQTRRRLAALRLGGDVPEAESVLRESMRAAGVAREFVAVGPLVRARFSPDGDRIVTVSGRTVQIWDVGSGALLDTLPPHPTAVVAAALTTRRNRVVTADADGRVRVWKSLEKRWRASTFTPKGKVADVAFDDAARPVTADNGGFAQTWKHADGHWVPASGRPSAHDDDDDFPALLQSVSAASRGGRVVTASLRYVWLSQPTGGHDRRWPATRSERSIVAAGIAANGTALFAADSNAAWVWRVAGFPADTPPAVDFAPGVVTAAALSSPGDLLAAAVAVDGGIQIQTWTRSGGVGLKIPSPAAINDVAVGCDGRCVLGAGADGVARLWDLVASAGMDQQLGTNNEPVIRAAGVSADAHFFFLGDGTGKGMVWDRARQCLTGKVKEEDSVVLADMAADSTSLVTASASGTVHARKLGTLCDDVGAASGEDEAAHRDLWEVRAASPLRMVVLDPAREHVLTSGDTNTQLWDVRSAPHDGKDLPVHELLAARFVADGTRVATSTADGLQLWDVATGGPAAAPVHYPDPVTHVAFDCTGRFMVTATADAVHFWSVNDGRESSRSAPARSVTALGVSCDGSVAAAGFADGVHLWRTDTAGALGTWQTASGIAALAFTSDARADAGLVAGIARDGEVQVWGIPERAIVAVPVTAETSLEDAHTNHVIGFAADDRVLLATSGPFVHVLRREAFAPIESMLHEFRAAERSQSPGGSLS